MGFFDNLTQSLRKAVELGVEIRSLHQKIDRLSERQILLLERIARLEERQRAQSQEAAEAARSAAHAGVYRLQAELSERLARIEARQDRLAD